MSRAHFLAAGVLLALAVLAVCLFLADFAFKRFEEARYITRVTVNDPLYDPPNLAYNDHGGVIARKKPQGEFRILFFGDSYTHGVTLAPYSPAAALERALNDALAKAAVKSEAGATGTQSVETGLGAGTPAGPPSSGPAAPPRSAHGPAAPEGEGREPLPERITVVNLGVPGTSFPGYIEQMAFWTAALEHDALIVQIYAGNDFTDVAATPFDAARLEKSVKELCEKGLARGYGTTVPKRSYFRFMDYLRAYWLNYLHTRKLTGLPLEFVRTAHAAAEPSPHPAAKPSVDASRYRDHLALTEAQFLGKMRESLQAFDPAWMRANPGGIKWLAALFGTLGQVQARGGKVMAFVSPPEAAVSGALRERLGLAGAASGAAGRDDAAALSGALGGAGPGGQDAGTGAASQGRPAGPGRDAPGASPGFVPGLPGALAAGLAAMAGLPPAAVADVSGCFTRAVDQGMPVYLPGETHWTVEGNELAARALASRILPAWFGLPAGLAGSACPEGSLAPAPDAAARQAAQSFLSGVAAPLPGVSGCGR